ncbi:MAG: transposase [Lachnospiraceae bacterium]|nr:transposase [Lachnospiraceae bacterium]
MRISFELVTALQYELRAAQRQLASFKSGQKYVTMKKEHEAEQRRLERKIRSLQEELHRLRLEQLYARQQWFESTDDMQAEYERQIRILQAENTRLYERSIKAEAQRDAAYDKITEMRRENYQLAAELEEEKGKNQKLIAQINKDFENSSLPSSAQIIRKKKIPNNREASGRKPGAQQGHPGYSRKKQTPTQTVLLQPSKEILDDPDFRKTSRTITKQLVNVQVCLNVIEYKADVYRNSKTGETCHAEFPDGVVDDVNYGSSIRAFLFMLNNDCCVSIDKCRDFLKNLTGGKLEISKGMISKLSKEFAEKSEALRKSAVSEMFLYPVVHADCTNARVNGRSAYVFVCAAPDGPALYYAREVKGHVGVAGTLIEDYQGILIHDHEKTFYRYGSAHQECLAHVLRYLKGSMENEPERTWNKDMHSLLQEMIHYVNGLEPGEEREPAKLLEYETRYDEILETGLNEYAYVPCSDYYRDGFNLATRMKEYRDAHLLFLHDSRVPTTNNLAERLLRFIKRKQNQAVTFRSNESLGFLCDSMSVLFLMRQEDDCNLYDKVSAVFG